MVNDKKNDGHPVVVMLMDFHYIGKAYHLKDKPPTDETKDQWLQNDACLFLMIRKSIEPSVIPLVDHCEYVKELIDYLDFLYSGQKNISRIYSVCKDFHRREQQDHSLTAYVMEFKKMYEELNSLLPISVDVKVMQKQMEQIAVMSFLTGLRPEFDSLSCQFLNETEIPSLQDTFARVIVNETLQSHHELLMRLSQGFNSDEVECYYCDDIGHTTRNCKKLLANKKGSSARTAALLIKRSPFLPRNMLVLKVP
ncbi:polyprotein [Tanacetum coccineum]|uniref:Polyprotein n=1 Tax=Tanacetum coccineum TaxID=301880 RepID=A0ABQ4Z6Q0_9ASTR